MIKRIRIKDYMAHKDTDLELDPGVTVLTGPNNSGKSAVVEALRSVAQNPPPHHVIRHGASQAVVRVELASGEAVEWVRSKSNPVYRLYQAAHEGAASGEEPEVYAKFGRTPPEDLRRLLRLDPVDTESGAIDIHIGNQRYPIFLLDQSGSQAASFFAASTEAEYLLRIQQALKTKTDRARSKRKELLQECTELEAVLKRYAPLAEIESELTAVEALHARLLAIQQALPSLQQALAALDELGRQVGRKERSSALLAELTLPPEIQETKGLILTLRELQGLLLRSEMATARAATLISLSEPPILGDTVRLEALIRAWENDAIGLSRRILAGEALKGLEVPPDPLPVVPLRALLGQWDTIQGSLEHSIARGEVLAALPAPPDLQAVAAGEDLLGRMVLLQGQLEGNIRLQEDLTSALTLRRREIEQVIQELGMCPLCGQSLDITHFLEVPHG